MRSSYLKQKGFLLNPFRFGEAGDPFWADTLLLYNFNRAIGSAAAVELTGKPTRSAIFGTPTYSSTRVNLGSTSLYCPRNTQFTDYLSAAIGTGPFTIEFSVNIITNNGTTQQYGYNRCFHNSSAGAPTTTEGVGLFNYTGFGAYSAGSVLNNIGSNPTNTWLQITIIGNGGPDGSRNIKYYINGSLVYTHNVNYNFTGRYNTVCSYYGSSGTYVMDAYMDYFRVTKANRYPTGTVPLLVEYPKTY